MNQFGVLLLVCWLLSVHLAIVSANTNYTNGRARWDRTVQLQFIVDRLRTGLDILEPVHVRLVDTNPLVMSVETLATRSGPFVIIAEHGFIDALTDEELEAALAHELGHVWIYTHHPYVQTERLANDIAMRVVARKGLEPVYEKVWKRIGSKGNLADLIGHGQQ